MGQIKYITHMVVRIVHIRIHLRIPRVELLPLPNLKNAAAVTEREMSVASATNER